MFYEDDSFLGYRPEDGDSTQRWNVSLPQRKYTVLHPRRLSSSLLPPREPEISPYYSLFISALLDSSLEGNSEMRGSKHSALLCETSFVLWL